MNADRIRAALRRIQYTNDEDRYTDGLLGRINPDDSVTYVPRGLANHKYVRIRNSDGSQSTVRARDDLGVQESRNLPVRLKATVIVQNSGVVTYTIVGLSRDESKASVPSAPSSGVPIHIHDDRYFTEAEHIAVSVGVADAGKPVKTDASGLLDASLIDPEDIADIVGTMVTGNTETGIAVTYQDADNTLDFVVDTEFIADTVGAMVTGNTETDIAVTYDDADNTLDFVVSPTLVADRISAAATDDTIADADLWGYVTGGTLVKTAWSNIKTALISAFVTNGTWSPVITGSVANPTTLTYSEQVGRYTTLFGTIVFYSFRLTIATYGGGSGDLRVSLPLTNANVNNADLVRAAQSLSGLNAPASTVSQNFRPQPGQSYGLFQSNIDDAGAVTIAIGDAAAGDILGAAGFYWL